MQNSGYALFIVRLNAHRPNSLPKARTAQEPDAGSFEEKRGGTNRFLAPNIDRRGRLLRAGIGATLLIGAAFGFGVSIWLGVLLATAGGFALFEAKRGWCAARACGIKTRL